MLIITGGSEMDWTDRPMTNEYRYQALKLWNSGKMSLTELKAIFRVVATVVHGDFSNETDVQSVVATMARLEKLRDLTETRSAARQRFILKKTPKTQFKGTREEEIAKFATGYKGGLPHNWKRYGNLVAQTDRYNPPRPMSSRSKINKTKYKGFKEINRDLDNFFKSLSMLLKDRKQAQVVRGEGRRALKGIKVKATPRY
tara:strand:- start:1217 stop:1816 length:600 start_codon:yes stop_codon:yes gene_type:complete